MTERLYKLDAFMKSFDASVLSCTEGDRGFIVVLDRSAFYPTGGGQPNDTGYINGVRVTDVYEKDGEVYHLCDCAVSPGKAECEIDFARRFDHMQQHSGEHIISGLICREYSCENVGFHLGADSVFIDFSAVIPFEDLSRLELLANEAIWTNVPFKETYYPSSADIDIDYRSKKELKGEVRITEFPGYDRCACCGTHVKAAGQVGIIKLLSASKLRGGTRLELMCGKRAFDYLSLINSCNTEISRELSAKPTETPEAVRRIRDELGAAKYRAYGLEDKYFALLSEKLLGEKTVILFEEGLSPDSLRKLCTMLLENTEYAFCFSGTDEGAYKYAIGKKDGDIMPFIKAFNSALSGKGGGRNGPAQGNVSAGRAEIEAYIKANVM